MIKASDINRYTNTLHNHFVKNLFLEKPAIAAKPSKVKKDERPVCMKIQNVVIFFDTIEYTFKNKLLNLSFVPDCK